MILIAPPSSMDTPNISLNFIFLATSLKKDLLLVITHTPNGSWTHDLTLFLVLMRRRGAISSLAKNICCSESFYTWQHAAEDLLHTGEEGGGVVLLKRGRKPTCSCIGTTYNGKESAIQLKELQHYRGENDFFFHLTAERFLERLLKFSKACFSVCLLIQKHQIEACRYRHCPFGWHFIYRKLSLLFLKMLMWGKCSFLVSQWNNVLECLVFKVHSSITVIEFDLYALDT